MMKKICRLILAIAAIFLVFSVFSNIGNSGTYPYPQNFLLDQRRFDQQQAANLIMRRLQTSSTDQWAIGVVDVSGGGTTVSTATYGMINSTGTTILVIPYAVKRFSVLPVGGLTIVSTNKTDGNLVLDDNMPYEQVFDYPVSSMQISLNVSTGVCHYAITGVR